MKHFSFDNDPIYDGVVDEKRFYVGGVTLDDGRYELHTHEYTEITLITGGEGVHQVETHTYPVAKGDIFVIHGNTSHGFTGGTDLSMKNIAYEEGVLFDLQKLRALTGYHAFFELEPAHRSENGEKTFLHLDTAQYETLMRIIKELENEKAGKTPGSETVIRLLFTHLVTLVSRYYEVPCENASSLFLPFAHTLAEVEANYTSQISLSDLAEHAGLSVSRFTELFRKHKGTSPIDYIIRLRITRASELLRTSESRVTDVAHAVGFDDSNYFSKVFKKVVGKSPRTYRAFFKQGTSIGGF